MKSSIVETTVVHFALSGLTIVICSPQYAWAVYSSALAFCIAWTFCSISTSLLFCIRFRYFGQHVLG